MQLLRARAPSCPPQSFSFNCPSAPGSGGSGKNTNEKAPSWGLKGCKTPRDPTKAARDLTGPVFYHLMPGICLDGDEALSSRYEAVKTQVFWSEPLLNDN